MSFRPKGLHLVEEVVENALVIHKSRSGDLIESFRIRAHPIYGRGVLDGAVDLFSIFPDIFRTIGCVYWINQPAAHL